MNKVLSPTIEAVNSFCLNRKMTLHTDHELLNGQQLSLTKQENGFAAAIQIAPYTGYSSSQLHKIDYNRATLSDGNSVYQIPVRAMVLNEFFPTYSLTMNEIHVKGSIAQLLTAEEEKFNQKFLRLVLPATKHKNRLANMSKSIINHLTSINGNARQTTGYIKVEISGRELHFWHYNSGEDTRIFIDSCEPVDIQEFREVSHSILLAYGFLFGDLILDEGFVLSSDSASFDKIENIAYSQYRESILSGYGMLTTNAYSIIDQTAMEEEKSIELLNYAGSWVNDLKKVEEKTFSELCELLWCNEPVNRAALITLQANGQALELKGSAYSVAFEAIVHFIIEKFKVKVPKPIPEELFSSLKSQVKQSLDQLLPANEENKELRKFIIEKFSNINGPTNMDKLKLAFSLVGYELQPYEIDVIKTRNLFQHGNLPTSANEGEITFQQLYAVCIVLHRLIYTLVLHLIGFKGYIINYPQIHKDIAGIDRKEKEFFLIQ